jgi:hypothetical protein
MITAGLIGAVDGNQRPMNEIMDDLARQTSMQEFLPLIAATSREVFRYFGYALVECSKRLGTDAHSLWQEIATELNQE